MNDDGVVDLITRAVAAVDAAGVPDDLREPAFTAAVGLLGGGVTPPPPGGSSGSGSGSSRGGSNGAAGGSGGGSTGSELLDKIATGLELDPKQVPRLYAEQDGQPVLKLKGGQLPAAKGTAATDIALLIMAARQVGGIDEYTDGEVLREAARQYGRFDSGNFGSSMKKLDHLVTTQGTGAATKRKLTIPGVEDAAVLAKKYLGVGDGS